MAAACPTRAAGLVAGLAALFAAGCTVVVRPADPSTRAERHAPPPVTVAPALAPIAGSPVVYVANWHEDIFVFESRWYRPYDGLWYRAASVRGPWMAISPSFVPRPVLTVPAGHRARVVPGPALVQPAAPVQQQAVQQQTTVQQQTVQQTVIVQQAAPVVVVPAQPAATAPAPARSEPVGPPRSAQAAASAPAPARSEMAAAPSSPARSETGAPQSPAHGARAQGRTPGRVTVAPALVTIEGSPVAYVENWPEALFRLEQQWYRQVDGVWYRSPDIAGDWTEVARADLPKAIVEVPGDYRGADRGGKGHGAPGKNKKKG